MVGLVRTASALGLASLADSLQEWGDNQLAIDSCIFTCITRPLKTVFDERALVDSRLKAYFATSALWVANGQLVDGQSVLSYDKVSM